MAAVERRRKRRRPKPADDGPPCARLVTFNITSGYSQSTDSGEHRTYKAAVSQTIVLDPEHPDFDHTEGKFKDPEFINSIRLFISEMLKKSIMKEMVDDGVLVPDEDDVDEDDEDYEDDDEDYDEDDEDDDEDDDDEDYEDDDDDYED